MNHFIKNKYWEINKDYNKEKLLYLLIDRSDYIDTNNNFVWLNDKNQFYRDYDLPALIWENGDVFWEKNNQPYRENNKPVYIQLNGYKEYWLNDHFIKNETSNTK